jgi:hypothetical protein
VGTARLLACLREQVGNSFQRQHGVTDLLLICSWSVPVPSAGTQQMGTPATSLFTRPSRI